MKKITLSLVLLAGVFSLSFHTTHSAAPLTDVVYVCRERSSMTCFHMLYADGKKVTYKDTGCRMSEERIIEGIKNGNFDVSEGWLYECGKE